MFYNIQCCICFEFIQHYSFCINCIDSTSCISCETKWINQRKDPKICFICRQKTRLNINEKNSELYESIITPPRQESIIIIHDNNERRLLPENDNVHLRLMYFFMRLFTLLIILYLISYIFRKLIHYIDLYLLLIFIFGFIICLFFIWLRVFINL